MKTLQHLSGWIAVTLAVVSCTKESGDSSPAQYTPLVPVTVEASVPATKVTLDGNTPLWSEGDQIGIFTEDLVLCPAFTALSGGSATTSFSGQKPEYSVLSTAFFPYDATATFSKSGLELDLPQAQSGKAGDAVMVATGSLEDGFTFQNVLSLVRMSVPAGLNLRKVELVRDDRVTGHFTVNVSASPFKASSNSPSTYLENRAEFSGSTSLSGEYYLTVLPSASKKIELALTRSDGKIAFISSTFKTGNPYTAGTIKNLGTLPTSLTFHDAALVADPANTQL